jgi:hypothetical protein
MDGFANHNRLYYHKIRCSIKAMFDGRLHIHFTGNYSLLGPVVVVSCDFRVKGIMPQSSGRQFQLPPKNDAPA